MSAPHATYRLQFREHLDFEAARLIMPYLARLGVSHAYASPLQAARPGSTHGYDGIDFNEIEPALGGLDGFRAMAQAIREAGLGLLLDIVPNHMGASTLNPWWRDVLQWGPRSRHAHHFDIDWSQARLLLPILGQTYAQALEAGALKLGTDATAGSFHVSYYESQLPLAPASYGRILADVNDPILQTLGRRFALAGPDEAESLKTALAAHAHGMLQDLAARMSADHSALHEILEMQIWRLAHWRNARERLSYRRFFEISELVGVRVESPQVFRDVHRLVLDLLQAGDIDGLRIDHVDGLADPLAYLQELRSALPSPDFYVVVEKILGPGEAVRPSWPIAGTTGYEFITALGGLLVDDARARELDAEYARFTGATADYLAMSASAKRSILVTNLASELEGLVRQVTAIAASEVATRDYGSDTLRSALVELATGLSVYRPYVDATGASAEDRHLIDAAIERARKERRVEDPSALAFLGRVLVLDVPARLQPAALRFARRFQQTTGPLMAKAIEDTLFYRYNRLIALNEVGGEPHAARGGVAVFHEAMSERRVAQPSGLSATATHDTKRGEDGRARLYVLSEMPEDWAQALQGWSQRHISHTSEIDGHRLPDPEMIWFFYQSLLGAWPMCSGTPDPKAIEDLTVRLQAMMQKAAREAKVHTTWTAPCEAYEIALAAYVRGVMTSPAARQFLDEFASFTAPILAAGAVNSLTQLLMKLAAPGVPDVYQGTELWDLSLVDPDNRRAVDFQLRANLAEHLEARTCADLIADWQSGALKMRLMMAGLALRRRFEGWEQASYVPVYAHGQRAHHVVSFARGFAHAHVLVVGVRLPLSLLRGSSAPLVDAAQWGDTRLVPPEQLVGQSLVDLVSGEQVQLPREGVLVSDVLRNFPVALLASA